MQDLSKWRAVFLCIILTSATNPEEECMVEEEPMMQGVNGGSSILQVRAARAEASHASSEQPPGIPASPSLKWEGHFDIPPFRFYEGELQVNIDPQDLTSPTLGLQVLMAVKINLSDVKGSILGHSGGPGSDAFEGVWPILEYAEKGYHTWGISQRGVGRKNKPSFHCPDDDVTLPDEKDNYEISDFTNCSCRMEDDTPLIGETWADIDPSDADEVRNLLTQVAKRGSRCRSRKEFQISPKHNFLDYAGTQMLAHDIEALRAAINVSKIHISGVSYGTYVGGVYASTYPSRIGKLILDGNVVPFPDKNALAQGCGVGIQQSINKLLYNCKEQIDKCPLKDPDEQFNKIIDQLRSGALTAPTATGDNFKLTVGLFGGWLQEKLASPTGAGWGPALKALATLLSDDEHAREVQVAEILNAKCTLHTELWTKRTWFHYNKCIGDAHVGIKGSGGSGFIHQLGVLGVDLAGRYTVSDAMRLWSDYKDKYGPLAAGAYIGILAGVFQWPVVPSPPAPLGNPSVHALIVGNLYDPSTSYQWSQEMHKAFSNSTMITWQGVGHGWGAGMGLNSSHECKHVKQFYINETLEQNGIHNGHTCRLEQELPVSLVQSPFGNLPFH